MLHRIIIIAFFVFIGVLSSAQRYEIVTQNNQLKIDGSAQEMLVKNASDLNKNVIDAKIRIAFSIDDQSILTAEDSVGISFVLKAKERGETRNEIFDEEKFILVLNRLQTAAYFQKNLSAFLTNGIDENFDFDNIELNIVSENVSGSRQELESAISFYWELTQHIGLDISGVELTNLDVNIGNTAAKEVIFSWDSIVPINYYQLELLRLYNTDGSKLDDERNISTTIDWSKASRFLIKPEIEEKRCSFSYSISEGTGYYIWRLRPYSNYTGEGEKDPVNYGNWTDAYNDGEEVSLSGTSNGFEFFFSDVEASSNYNYLKVFSEQAKIKEQVSYANGLNQERQTITYLPSNDVTLLSHSVLDYSGRPAVFSIPIPKNGKILSFNDVMNGYSAGDFDTDDNILSPEEAEVDYYNGQRANVPDAEGFSYTRKVFYNDGTGRVKEESGLGKINRIHNESSEELHTTRYLYDAASETELIALFGSDAPSSKHVLKEIVVDPNNVATITYKTDEGNVIATGLSFYDSSSGNLEDIDSEPLKQIDVVSDINTSSRTETGFINSKKITLLQASNLLINYRVSNAEIADMCVTSGFDCNYQLKITVYKIERDNEIQVEKIVSNLEDDGNDKTANLSVALESGTYLIQKELVSTEMESTISTNADEVNKQVTPITDQIAAWLSVVDTRGRLDSFFYSIAAMADAINYRELDHFTNEVYCDLFEVSLDTTFFDDVYNKELYYAPEVQFKEYYSMDIDSLEDGSIQRIVLSTPCCKELMIPVDWIPPFSIEKNDFVSLDTMPDFEQFGLDFLGSYVSEEDFYDSYMIGWEKGEFNEMVYNMVKSYDYYRDGELIENYVYNCSDLYDCWLKVLNNLEHLIRGTITYSVNSDTTVSDTYDSEYESSKDYNDEVYEHDEVFDGIADQFSWWLRRKINKRLSKAIRDMQSPGGGSDSGLEGGGAISFELPKMHLVEEFLNCSGYEFEKILTPLDPYPEDQDIYYEDDVLGIDYNYLDLNKSTNPGLLPVVTNYIETDDYRSNEDYKKEDGSRYYIPLSDWGWTNSEGVVVTSLVKNPCYAFKYFHYDDFGENKSLEGSFCFTDPNDCYIMGDNEYYEYDEISINAKKYYDLKIIPCCWASEEGPSPDPANSLCFEYENYPALSSGSDSKSIVNNFCGIGRIICDQYYDTWDHAQNYSFLRSIEDNVEPDDSFWAEVDLLDCDDLLDSSTVWYTRTDYPVPNGFEEENLPYLITADERSELESEYEDYSFSFGGIDILLSRAYDKEILEYTNENGVLVQKEKFPYIEKVMRDEKFECVAKCEEKRSDIERELREVIEENCYQLEGCRTTNPETFDVIPIADFDLIVDAVVEQCKGQCSITTYSCETVGCRRIDKEKISYGGETTLDIQIGVAGHPDASANGFDDDVVEFYEEIDFDGDGIIDARRYKFGEYPEMYVSWYEYTLQLQVAEWFMELSMPNKCEDVTNEELDCKNPQSDTFVKKEEYKINTSTIVGESDERFKTPVLSPSTVIEVNVDPN